MSDVGRPTPEPSPWGLVLAAASIGFLIGGILMPGIAASLLRVFIAALALGWVAARALGIGLPAAMVHDTYSPFDGGLADLAPPSLPDVVWRRARALAAADDPTVGALRPIPWPVALVLQHEAERRLERGHGLRLDRPSDAARIRSLVSEITWTFLSLEDPAGTVSSGGANGGTVLLKRLDDILDDLERL